MGVPVWPPKMLLSLLPHCPHPSDHRPPLFAALRCVRSTQSESSPGWPQAGNVPPAHSLSHIRGAQGRQMQPRDTHHVQRAQLQICSALFAFLVQLRSVSSPQKNQSEHLYHIPVLCTTLSVALANWSSLFYSKTSVFSSCTPRYTTPPSFHQQTTVQTKRSSSHLSGT